VTPNTLSFTVVGVPQSITLTNSGNTVLTLQSITVGDQGFTQTNTCGSTLAPAAACTVSITVNSLGTTALNSTLTIVANDAAGTHTVALGAVAGGTLPPLSISSSSLTFPSTLLYFSSPVQTFTITNNTPYAIGFSVSLQGAAADNYMVNASCPYPLPGGQSCTEQIAFKPVIAGEHHGSLEFSSNSGSLASISLTGTGIAGTGGAVTLSPSSLSFTKFGVPAPVTVTNTGATAVAIGPISIDSNSGYTQTNNCGSSLAPQSICTIDVSATGISNSFAYIGNLTVIAGDATGTHTIPLSTPVSTAYVTPKNPMVFGSWVVGSPSVPQTFSFDSYPNAVNYQLQITGPDANDFSFDPTSTVSFISGNGCVTGCSIPIYFTPSRLGSHTANLVTNFGNVMLAGTGSTAVPSFVLSGNIPTPPLPVLWTRGSNVPDTYHCD